MYISRVRRARPSNRAGPARFFKWDKNCFRENENFSELSLDFWVPYDMMKPTRGGRRAPGDGMEASAEMELERIRWAVNRLPKSEDPWLDVMSLDRVY